MAEHVGRRCEQRGVDAFVEDVERPDVLQGLESMGDLSRFAIEDLTPEDEEELFRILEQA